MFATRPDAEDLLKKIQQQEG
jgi:hypothetical protein